jgi:3-phenylpropionate/trans-cinnamate dioxygenase ferredoxin component
MYRFDVVNKALLVVKSAGKFFATDSICTHEEADLSLGMFSDGVISCPLHNAKFRVNSGEVLSGPDGSSPDKISKLKVYGTKVENGELYVDL